MTYPNGAIVSFSGTGYVFAGGHAFGIPTSRALAALQQVDQAASLVAPPGAQPPTGAPRPGTLLSTRAAGGAATVYVAGNDGRLHGFASPEQMVEDGYDTALVVSVPSLSGVAVGATVGSLGAAADASTTAADGAIVDSSGAYYLFAGGRAFAVADPASLVQLRLADDAVPLSRVVGARLAAAQVANGVVLSIRGTVYVAYGGQLWPFKSKAQLAADGYGGTSAVPARGTGSLSIVATYSGS